MKTIQNSDRQWATKIATTCRRAYLGRQVKSVSGVVMLLVLVMGGLHFFSAEKGAPVYLASQSSFVQDQVDEMSYQGLGTEVNEFGELEADPI